MKKLLLFILCPCLMTMVSCQNQHGSHPASNHNDTVICNAIKLGIRTIDEKGNNLTNCITKCYIHDYGTVLIDSARTPVEKCITSTTSWAVVHIQGAGFSEDINFYTGITRDTTIVFVIKRCK